MVYHYIQLSMAQFLPNHPNNHQLTVPKKKKIPINFGVIFLAEIFKLKHCKKLYFVIDIYAKYERQILTYNTVLLHLNLTFN
jgi:hypothetical protein